jgi:hypothetical protein
VAANDVQRRWRENTRARKVELYLAPAILAALDQAVKDAGARGRGSRGATLLPGA